MWRTERSKAIVLVTERSRQICKIFACSAQRSHYNFGTTEHSRKQNCKSYSGGGKMHFRVWRAQKPSHFCHNRAVQVDKVFFCGAQAEPLYSGQLSVSGMQICKIFAEAHRSIDRCAKLSSARVMQRHRIFAKTERLRETKQTFRLQCVRAVFMCVCVCVCVCDLF